ncbi:MAG: site-specific integrase, partial [Phycisphaerales bacterium]
MGQRHEGTIYKKSPTATKWTGAFTHPHTKKRVVKTLYTDLRASQKRLQEMVIEAERETEGIGDRFREHRQRHISEHVAEYLAHCEHVGESPVHRGNKRTQLERMLAGTQATRLPDLEPNRIERHLQALARGGRVKQYDKSQDKGLSARSVNQHRATIVAFVQWCVDSNRAPDNPLRIVPKQDERKDRRRIRRALSVEELGRLVGVSDRYRPVYTIAAYTGLRRSELAKITWGDVDAAARQLRVRVGVGKAAREDYVPI